NSRLDDCALLQRSAQRSVVVEHEEFDDGQRQSSVAEQLIVENTEAESVALLVAVAAEQPHDLPLAGDIRDLLRRTRSRAGRFTLGGFAIEATAFHEVVHRLLEA